MPSKKANYYDIDAILAEEAFVPCSTLFDFSFLSHLDPDHYPTATNNERDGNPSEEQHHDHVLPQNSRIQMPLWAMEKWAVLGYIRLTLPKQFARKARERLQADPSQVALGKRNERFFLTGRRLVHLLQQHCTSVRDAIRRSSATGTRQRLESLAHLQRQAGQLQRTLVTTYSGLRLSQTLNWALSSVGDDVAQFTAQLTAMEKRLFRAGATAAAHHAAWKLHGRPPQASPPAKKKRSVTPDLSHEGNEPHNKRRRSMNNQ